MRSCDLLTFLQVLQRLNDVTILASQNTVILTLHTFACSFFLLCFSTLACLRWSAVSLSLLSRWAFIKTNEAASNTASAPVCWTNYGHLCSFYGNLCQIVLWSFSRAVVLNMQHSSAHVAMARCMCLHAVLGGFVSYVHVYPSPFLSSGGLSARVFAKSNQHWTVWHIWMCCMKITVSGATGGCRKHTGFNLISTDFSLRCTLCTHIWGWTEILQRNKFYSLGSFYSQIGANVSLKRQSSSVCRRG